MARDHQTRIARFLEMLTVSAENARHFLAAHHMLSPARSLTGGPEAVIEVMRRLGSIQFDPIAVAGRNQDLVLHARVAGYEPEWTERLLYDERRLFEAYNKGLSLLPMAELPWFRVSWTQAEYAPKVLSENAQLVTTILERIRDEGPVTTLEFESGRGTNWWGAPMSVASVVLDALISTGVVGLARRDGNRRYFDLAERVFPADLLAREVPRREQLRHKLLSRFRAHGLLGPVTNAMIGMGPARPDPKKPGTVSIAELREELVTAGEIVPVQVEGLRRPRFVVATEADLLAHPPEPAPSVAFLPVFDPLVWSVKFLKELYDFEYVLELWRPEPKRRWGYYVLPIHFRARLVGRIEPRIDRQTGLVRLLGLWWEEWFDPEREDGFIEAMREALGAYLRFAHASKIEWVEHLSREERLFAPDKL